MSGEETEGGTGRPRPVLVLARRMASGAMGPLLSFIALFALPLSGAVFLNTENFAFWAILSSISTIALSLDFGGVALLTTRYHAEARRPLLIRSAALSALGAVIVGLVATGVWWATEASIVSSALPLMETLAAIIVMSMASMVRSVLMVIAQAALLADDLRLRNIVTAGHAVAASLLTIVLLVSTRSFWALPLGWLISGLLLLAPTGFLVWHRLANDGAIPMLSQPIRGGRFALLRTLATLCGAVLLQSDKWIIGAIGGPGALAIYEVAWRFANLPRFLVQNLAVRVGTDGSSLASEDSERLRALLRHSTVICVVVAAAASLAVAGLYLTFTWSTDLDASPMLFSAMVITFSALSLTAPWSFAGVALGRAGVDIPYVTVALFVELVGVIAAVLLGNVWSFVAIYLAGMWISLGVFSFYAPRWVSGALVTRTRTAPVQ